MQTIREGFTGFLEATYGPYGAARMGKHQRADIENSFYAGIRWLTRERERAPTGSGNVFDANIERELAAWLKAFSERNGLT